MRQIGQLPDAAQARRFGDHLTARRIRHEIEPDDSVWLIWIHDDEQVADAREELARFIAAPEAAEFRSAGAEAARIRTAAAEELARYRQRLRSRRAIFPKFGPHGVGLLTFGLVALCIVVALLSNLGTDDQYARKMVLADPDRANGTFLPEVRAGEYWRLITPILLHFGPAHLIFNLMWLYQLGSMIEGRLGVATFGALVLVGGTVPLIGQYLVNGLTTPGLVGGMSGVVYALGGFAWMRGRHDPASGVSLSQASWVIMLLWLVVCYAGWMGRVANTAHLVGLVVGLIWGRVSAYHARRRPE
jgi:GlpG protein